MDDKGLVERLKSDAEWLREFVRGHVGLSGHCWNKRHRAEQHEKDIATLIETQAARIEALEGALEPFAKAADFDEYAEVPDDTNVSAMLCGYGEEISDSLTFGDLRKARAAIRNLLIEGETTV